MVMVTSSSSILLSREFPLSGLSHLKTGMGAFRFAQLLGVVVKGDELPAESAS
jgi:hypothetical protein